MQVFRGIPARATHSTVLTIGNFDGVHRGHQRLVAENVRPLMTERAAVQFRIDTR